MLGNRDATANVAVKNLDTARRFYQDTLGLTPVTSEGDEVVVFKSGNSQLFVYRSQCAGSNKATAVSWVVDGPAKGLGLDHPFVQRLAADTQRMRDALVAPGAESFQGQGECSNSYHHGATFRRCDVYQYDEMDQAISTMQPFSLDLAEQLEI